MFKVWNHAGNFVLSKTTKDSLYIISWLDNPVGHSLDGNENQPPADQGGQ